eukprot:TRINITY_DN24210_c0_g1_i1.p1 TRINITY_DN24210_c0_g1~~TRINITY_DN24210_c0_g1_i1.p1  ORF type:complete len:1016 (+),score=331.04 TRINITY_DN24210_c0_g1_i1:111-3050(+)
MARVPGGARDGSASGDSGQDGRGSDSGASEDAEDLEADLRTMRREQRALAADRYDSDSDFIVKSGDEDSASVDSATRAAIEERFEQAAAARKRKAALQTRKFLKRARRDPKSRGFMGHARSESSEESVDGSAVGTSLESGSDSEGTADSSQEGRRARAGRGRRPGGGDDGDDGDDSGGSGGEEDEEEEEDDEDERVVDFAQVSGAVQDWLHQEPVRLSLMRSFRQFLRTYKPPEEPAERAPKAGARDAPESARDPNRPKSYYMGKLHDMVSLHGQSLTVKYMHLARFKRELALFAGQHPAVVLPLFDEVAFQEVRRITSRTYARKLHTVHVRLTDFPVTTSIRNLRAHHMGMLVRTTGVVTRRSQVYPQLQACKFDCMQCGFTVGPIMVRGAQEAKVKMCPNCQGGGPFRLNSSMTIYRNYQTVILQESPSQVPPGRLPRHVECVLLHDLVDRARPGDDIDITGQFVATFDPSINSKQGFPVFSQTMEVCTLSNRVQEVLADLTDSDKQMFEKLARHPRIVSKIIASIAPSIHGHEEIKAGLACALFGAVYKEVGEAPKHRVRGDINVLLVGDPGCGKSQMLKYVEKTSPRAVFTTGRGSTAVGLTASVHRDSMTGEWTLEGGALVKADKGHCLIDEFDKMSDADRTSIHEAMEQQTISIAKAGIMTSLQARCSIVAAANPVSGCYDVTQSFEKQCNLTQPILSRFDLLFAVRDIPSAAKETVLAKFICNSHTRNWCPGSLNGENGDDFTREKLLEGLPDVVPSTDPDSPQPFPQDFLRKYILYARERCHPNIEKVDFHQMQRLYTQLRSDSTMKYESGVKIVVRHLESMIRLSEAYARMRLSEWVQKEDVDRAIALFLNCFLQTLTSKRQKELKQRYAKFLVPQGQHEAVLLHALDTLAEEKRRMLLLKFGSAHNMDISVHYDDFHEAAIQYKVPISAVADFIQSDRVRLTYRVATISGDELPRDHNDVREFVLRPQS